MSNLHIVATPAKAFARSTMVRFLLGYLSIPMSHEAVCALKQLIRGR
jgi:hypothetical protein